GQSSAGSRMTLVPSRRTSTVSVWNRNSCGSRTAWLRPVQNTFARLVFIVTQASVIHTNDTYHRGSVQPTPSEIWVQSVARRCATVRAPRAVLAWNNWVQAISSVAKGSIPIRWEHAPDYASALSLSVADP